METYIHKPTKVLAQRWYPGVKIDVITEVPDDHVAMVTGGSVNIVARNDSWAYSLMHGVVYDSGKKTMVYITPGQWLIKEEDGAISVMNHEAFVKNFEQSEL